MNRCPHYRLLEANCFAESCPDSKQLEWARIRNINVRRVQMLTDDNTNGAKECSRDWYSRQQYDFSIKKSASLTTQCSSSESEGQEENDIKRFYRIKNLIDYGSSTHSTPRNEIASLRDIFKTKIVRSREFNSSLTSIQEDDDSEEN